MSLWTNSNYVFIAKGVQQNVNDWMALLDAWTNSLSIITNVNSVFGPA